MWSAAAVGAFAVIGMSPCLVIVMMTRVGRRILIGCRVVGRTWVALVARQRIVVDEELEMGLEIGTEVFGIAMGLESE